MEEKNDLEAVDKELDESAPRFILLTVDNTDESFTYEISGWNTTEAIGPVQALLDKLRADALDEWEDEDDGD